jgi:uncharacterized protein YndB with AHSA1/START domain
MRDTDEATDAVVIERTFDSPIEQVWQMWTVPEHFAAWYGPTGASIPVANMDVRVGGSRHICMEMDTPGGPMQMWFAGVHLEVVENERLVYTETIADEHGNPVPPETMGLPDGHSVTEVRVELDTVDGRTRMVMTHLGVAADSPGAAGWIMAFDKLTALIDGR